jgi:4-oxalomesaconate tautomerase
MPATKVDNSDTRGNNTGSQHRPCGRTTNNDNGEPIDHTSTMAEGVRCMIMRGGSSKGAYFVASDLPDDPADRDRMLLAIMGSPDARQIDGIGGAHPLTSKVAIVAPAASQDCDVDYLFLQVGVDQAMVGDRQNCGNLLAGVGPFALERGLIDPVEGQVRVRVRMLNTASIAVATFAAHAGLPMYAGTTAISGVPGTAAPISLDFEDIAGSSTGALLPTGELIDTIAGIDATLVDNGMPVVVLRADDLGVTGYETCAGLEANAGLRSRLEEIRIEAGRRMNLGDVTDTTVPKLTLVAPPRHGGSLSTRTFIPHRCHDAIGVLGAISVATAALLPGTPANQMLAHGTAATVGLEHPTGTFEAVVEVREKNGAPIIERAGIVRTARKLMDGVVFPRPD